MQVAGQDEPHWKLSAQETKIVAGRIRVAGRTRKEAYPDADLSPSRFKFCAQAQRHSKWSAHTCGSDLSGGYDCGGFAAAWKPLGFLAAARRQACADPASIACAFHSQIPSPPPFTFLLVVTPFYSRSRHCGFCNPEQIILDRGALFCVGGAC